MPDPIPAVIKIGIEWRENIWECAEIVDESRADGGQIEVKETPMEKCEERVLEKQPWWDSLSRYLRYLIGRRKLNFASWEEGELGIDDELVNPDG
jgi:hypothetical protein